MKTFTIKVPRHPGRNIRIIVADRAWVAKGFDGEPLMKGYEAAAWFHPSLRAKYRVGTIALSSVDLNLVAHECCHAAHHLGGDEERVCLLTGELTTKVWERLTKERP